MAFDSTLSKTVYVPSWCTIVKIMLYRVLLVFIFALSANAFNILGFFFLPVRSHYVFLTPLLTELAKRGHDLTIYSIFPFKTERFPNFKVIDIGSCFSVPTTIPITQSNPTTIQTLQACHNLIPKYEKIANCSAVIELVESTAEYDAFITDIIFPEWYTTFAYKFKVPLINAFPTAPYPQLTNLIGTAANPSFVPVTTGGFISKMVFWERVQNFYMYVMMAALNDYYLAGPSNDISRRVFGRSVPPVEEIVRNTSLTLINVDFNYRSPVPLAPNVVTVAGIHIKDSNTKLPLVSYMTLTF